MKTIKWDKNEFYYSDDVFKPKQSSVYFLEATENVLAGINSPVHLIDMCCGTGAVGLSVFLSFRYHFSYYIGLDNNPSAIDICTKNIKRHSVNGKAMMWSAGDEMPEKVHEGLVLCNPPFLPRSKCQNPHNKELDFVTAPNNGLGVIFPCFESISGTGHLVVLKSLLSQVETLKQRVSGIYQLNAMFNKKIEKDYHVAFTTWSAKGC